MRYALVIILATLLVACSSKAPQPAAYGTGGIIQSTLERDSVHAYMSRLARQLFDSAGSFNPDKPIAVGTILPSNLGTGTDLPESPELGLQMQESLVTLSAQAGLNVMEFKTTQNIVIEPTQDRMMSRQISQLTNSVDTSYFLTGTWSKQETSLVVNLRLIDLADKKVIAAATDYVPLNVAWRTNKVITKGGHIYRNEY